MRHTADGQMVHTLSAAEFLSRFAPTEWPTWEQVRAEYETEHPVIMAALRDDLPNHGMLRPIEVIDGRVENGHHRLLAALDTDTPVDYVERAERSRIKEFWDPETRRHYGPDEDYDDEGQLRY